jgi:hypothetical protein
MERTDDHRVTHCPTTPTTKKPAPNQNSSAGSSATVGVHAKTGTIGRVASCVQASEGFQDLRDEMRETH